MNTQNVSAAVFRRTASGWLLLLVREAAEVMLQTAYVNVIIIISKMPLEFLFTSKLISFYVLTFIFLSDPVQILCSLYYNTNIINVVRL